MNSPTTTITNDVAAHLTKIGLRATAEILDDLIARVAKSRWNGTPSFLMLPPSQPCLIACFTTQTSL